jgi:hypothetical protein
MKLTKNLEEFLKRPRRRVLAWASPRNPEVSAILVGHGQKFDRETYLVLLADRIEELVNKEEDPKAAEAELRRQLDQAGLLPDNQLSLRELVTSNPELHARLSVLGAFPKVGEVVKEENQEARQLVKEVSLEQWLDRLTRGLDEHLS